MSINVTTLCKMQMQLLKPLSPNQEYALVVLLMNDLREGDVASLAQVVMFDYPQLNRLYDAFAAANEYENAVPFILPVLRAEDAVEEIFQVANQALVVSPTMQSMLTRAMEEVIAADQKQLPEQWRYREGSAPSHIGSFIDCMLDAYNCGLLPMVVRPTKDQQAMRNDRLLSFEMLRDRDMFSGSLDFTKALQPSEKAKAIAAQLISRLHRIKPAHGYDAVAQ